MDWTDHGDHWTSRNPKGYFINPELDDDEEETEFVVYKGEYADWHGVITGGDLIEKGRFKSVYDAKAYVPD